MSDGLTRKVAAFGQSQIKTFGWLADLGAVTRIVVDGFFLIIK